MVQINTNTTREKGKHLTYEERIKIEILSKQGMKSEEIGKEIGCSGRTIRRELAKGRVELLNSNYTARTEYSADIAQQKHDYAATAKGANLKISNNYGLVEYIENLIIKEKYSPYAAAQKVMEKQDEFNITVCFKTIYNYIDKDVFPNLTNKHLPVKKEKKRNYNKIRTATNNKKGTGISERSKEIETREEYGHWEMDTVVGKKGTGTVLLVLSERKTRQEVIFKLKSKSQYCVVKAIDKLERKMGSKKFKESFKTITCDNGCENLDYEGIERSAITKGNRTKVYYAHPYSAWERGTNENINKLIRRFIPKGTDIGKFSEKEIQMIEHWINNYPRKIFNGKTANMMLNNENVA